MPERLIAAVTPSGHPYPPYLNVSDLGDGTVRIILRGNVRGWDTPTPQQGQTVIATMPMAAWEVFVQQASGIAPPPSDQGRWQTAEKIAR